MISFQKFSAALALAVACYSVPATAAPPANIPELDPADDINALTLKVKQITDIAAQQSAHDYRESGMWVMESEVKACKASSEKKPAQTLYCVQYDAFTAQYDHSAPAFLRQPYFSDATFLQRRRATLAATFTESSIEILEPMLADALSASTKSQEASPGPTPEPAASAPPRPVVRQFDDPRTVTAADWIRRPSLSQMDAAFPKRALEWEVSGQVQLVCTVTENTIVTDCRVVSEQPANWGFGEAALKTTPTMRIRPRIVDGRPVASQVSFILGFEMTR